MTYPLVQFVSAPDPSAEVRFDFNDAGEWADDEAWPEHDGFGLGVPSLEGDPDGVGVEYGFRELSFNLILSGDRVLAQRRMSALAREILRRENWLMFQLDETSRPVWFKTYRSSPGELSFEHVYVAREGRDMWGLGVTLTADPFAYGERVTLPTVTIANDPTVATNPMMVALPQILGDAPAPLRIEAVSNTDFTFKSPLISVHSTDRTLTEPIHWPTVELIGGTDTDAADTTAAGYAGGAYRRITFATSSTLTNRLSGYPLGISGTQPPGKYKVLVRLARSDTSSAFTVRLRQKISILVSDIYGPEVSFGGSASSAAGRAAWVDLGEFSWPTNMPKDEVDLDVPQGVNITFEASRKSGTGNLRVDEFLLLPMDGPGAIGTTTLVTEWGFAPSAGQRAITEGDGEFVAAPDLVIGPRVLRGTFPVARPGVNNYLHYVHQTAADEASSSVATSDAVTVTTDLTVSYRPRWLYLGSD